MIQNLIFVIIFLKNIISGVQLYSTRSSGHHQSFFYSRICSRKSQSQLKPTKKITHFTIQFCSKNLTHFTNLNSFEIENNMLPEHSQKTLSVYKFSRKHVSGKCLYISVYLSRKILFQRPSKILKT